MEAPKPQKFSVLRMKLTGAKSPKQIAGIEKLPGIVNYFKGNDPKQWHSNIPTFKKAKFAGVYKGVDMVYYGTQDGKLEYDIVVKPGADPNQIKLAFSGATGARITPEGDLALNTDAGEIRWQKPVTYLNIVGIRKPVQCAYKIESDSGKTNINFVVARYDNSKPLIIDPVLVYSTYYGGAGNSAATGIAIEKNWQRIYYWRYLRFYFPNDWQRLSASFQWRNL